MANRVTFLVDGFNLYFSVRHAEAALRTSHLRWLDVAELLGSFLYLFGTEAILEGIHFFTAVPDFLFETDPAAILGFRAHLQALRETGVHVHFADFKRKSLTCPRCGVEIDRYEEKETDVALGVKAIELLHLHACDTLQSRGLTQTQAGELLGIDQGTVSKLVNGRLDGFSQERLVRYLTALGLDVEIVVRPADRPGDRGRLTVAVL